jgi:rare lipoprotein A
MKIDQKNLRRSFAVLLMAASFVISPSYTDLSARETDLDAGISEMTPLESDVSKENQAEEDGRFYLVAEGRASYYSNRFHGRRTASGEHFDRRDFTAAHRSLPFGTRVRVTNLANGRKVFVKINDRGPHLKSRIIDISQAAARELGMIGSGIGNVRIEAVN